MTRHSVATTILVVIISTLLGFVVIGIVDAATDTQQTQLTIRVPRQTHNSNPPGSAKPVERGSDSSAPGVQAADPTDQPDVQVPEPTDSTQTETSTPPPPPVPDAVTPTPSPVPETAPDVATVAPPARGSEQTLAAVEQWAAGFSAAHAAGDVEHLERTLNPAVADAYGAETCSAYIGETAGSINSVQILNVDDPAPYTMGSPTGDLTFADAVEVVARWTVTHTGEEAVAEFHLVPGDSGFTWLTTCGQPAPQRA